MTVLLVIVGLVAFYAIFMMWWARLPR